MRKGEDRQQGRTSPAVHRRMLKAQTRLAKLRAGVGKFFDSRPFLMSAAADSVQEEHDLYRFRMIRRIPIRQQWIARRLLSDLRKLVAHLGADLSSTSTLQRLSRIAPGLRMTVLTPGVHAETTLVMDGAMLTDSALLRAPHWNARSREVTVVRHDPQGQLRGAIDVLYHLEFHQAADLTGKSALDLFTTALREAELAIGKPSTDGAN